MIRNCAALALCLALAGCGSAPPVQEDRFYRLQPTPVALAGKALPAPVVLEPLLADSLYAERAVVFTEEANPRQLRQYHYHLWLYAPAQTVRDHLAASLPIELAAGAQAPYALDGRIVRFDRVLGGRGGKASVALALRLRAGARSLLARTYEAEHEAADGSFAAFVAAMERALGSIYAEFARDLAALPPG